MLLEEKVSLRRWPTPLPFRRGGLPRCAFRASRPAGKGGARPRGDDVGAARAHVRERSEPGRLEEHPAAPVAPDVPAPGHLAMQIAGHRDAFERTAGPGQRSTFP